MATTTTNRSNRLVKRTADGAVKTLAAGPAARLVARGSYEYIDGKEDESVDVVLKDSRRLSVAAKKPAPVIKGFQDMELKLPESIDSTRKRITPTRKQKVTKVSNIAPETMETIKAVNQAPVEAVVTRDSDSLKALIDKAKKKRTSKS